jgi:hypothetical protein
MGNNNEDLGLSEEEIAALAEDDQETEGEDTDTEEEDTTAIDAKPDDESKDDQETEGEEKAAEPESAAEEEEEEEDKTVDAAGMSDPFYSKLGTEADPEAITTELDRINTDLAALDLKLSEGEIEYAEHITQNRALGDERTALIIQQGEAEFVARNNKVNDENAWAREVQSFEDDNPEFKTPVFQGALNGVLNSLYKDEAHAGKPYGWYLQEAGRQVNEALGQPTAAEDITKDERKAVKAAKVAGKKKAVPPKSLGGVPEAEGTTKTGDEFSALDDMNGMELEERLSKMSKADQDKFLNTRTLHS